MAFRYHRLANFLSVDVALGACAGMYFFASMLRVELKPVEFFLMALSVWVIYTFDHLLDARHIPADHASPRHRFHQRHFLELRVALFVAAVAVVVVAFLFLPSTLIFVTALVLGGLILVNLLLTQYFKQRLAPWKETSIALFYVLGILLLPLFKKEFLALNLTWIAFAFGYFLLAWYNLVFLSLLDYETDKLSGQRSLATTLGHRWVKKLLQWMGILGLVYFLALLFLLPSYYHVFTVLLLLMFTWHVRYFLEYRKFPKESLRRRLELSFLMPMALIVLPL
ncbi:MAG: UbiA family prenyltransferase [Lunatimonas sp.]|uniref:UbiA family prenyltransferase n=1 Tax=Lunatimonas sp. TaxID=2060141 RepID=UPI00263A685B|nr:UbiA family prenyltransferase [Lunatimonas sp.]MCC5937463.1 UbiA family prenyltransferase [Lunatimonas sp.]